MLGTREPNIINKHVIFGSNSLNPFDSSNPFYQYTLQNPRYINLFSFLVKFSQAPWPSLTFKPQFILPHLIFLTIFTLLSLRCKATIALILHFILSLETLIAIVFYFHLWILCLHCPHPSLLSITWNPSCHCLLLSSLNSLPLLHHHHCALLLP